MMGLKDDDGRWIQDEGEIDIQCMTEPKVLLETPLVVFTLVFYTNNEPHITFTSHKKKSIEVMKYAMRALVAIREKFDSMGYDKIFSLVLDDDQPAKQKLEWLGFYPTIIYDSPGGIRYIKYEMETT